MAEIVDWSTTAASNNSSPPDGWPENMNYSEVNDSAREGMAVLARWYQDTNGVIVSGGSANTQTLTSNRTIGAYAQGQVFVFEAGFTNTGTTTMNVSSLGAKTIKNPSGSNLSAGQITAGGIYIVAYEATAGVFILIGGVGAATTSAEGLLSAADKIKIDSITTGTCWPTFETSAPTGWILVNDGTIGNASSGATTRANADTSALFTLIWNGVSNTYAPIFDSGGSPSTRGASAAADFAANKRLQVGTILGRALSIAGAGSGLTSRSLGQTVGEETHTMTSGELVAHTHTITVGGQETESGKVGVGGTSFPDTLSTNSTGSTTPFNVIGPRFHINLKVKL